MDLRLLGPVEARLDDGPIELGPRKQRAVLAMLALQAGRTVSADRLVEGLWGEEPPASASSSTCARSPRSAATTHGCSTSSASGRRCGTSRSTSTTSTSRTRGPTTGRRRLGRRLPRAVQLHPRATSGAPAVRTSRGSAIACWTARSSARSARRRPMWRPGRPPSGAPSTSHQAVPLTYRRSAVLLSDRAGNAKTHLAYWTLLDQMWVR